MGLNEQTEDEIELSKLIRFSGNGSGHFHLSRGGVYSTKLKEEVSRGLSFNRKLKITTSFAINYKTAHECLWPKMDYVGIYCNILFYVLALSF